MTEKNKDITNTGGHRNMSSIHIAQYISTEQE